MQPIDEQRLFDDNKSKQILEELYKWLKKEQQNNLTFIEWILSREIINNEDGIERFLHEQSFGIVTIGFTNKVYQKLEELLSRNEMVWDEKMIDKAYNFATTPQEFIKSLEIAYWKKTGNNFNLIDNIETFINNNYIKFRNIQDTFKAIYRLSVIGVVDDYEIDYRTKTITAKISKKEDREYINNLKKYKGKYVAATEKSKIPKQIKEMRGDTILQKCCGFLIEFVYSKIASKRYEAINVMESAISAGIDDSKKFEEIVNTYFDSKYTNELRNHIYEYTIELVWEYLNKTDGEPNSINHLRGACDRLLVENPDNPALLLMRAFSRLIIPQYNKADAVKDFRKGWSFIKDLKKWTRLEYLDNLSKYYDIANKYDSSCAKYLDNEIVNEHLIWVKGFNNNFLEGNINA